MSTDAVMSAAETLPPVARSGAYDAAATLSQLAAAVLDEVDFPMLLVDGTRRLLHMNRAARRELAGNQVLTIAGGSLQVGPQAPRFRQELEMALRHCARRVLACEEGDNRFALGVVPLKTEPANAAEGNLERCATLLVLGRRRLSPALSVQWFARELALTPSEGRVLALLCAGLPPREVARRHGVSLSTVRTQVSAIRAKASVDSVRHLLSRVAALPPIVELYEAAEIR